MLAHGMAAAQKSPDAVTGDGHARRAALRPRAQGARGSSACAAPASPSTACYYVKSVTHTIKRGEYKQSFTLTRNGLVSTLPRVPV